MKIKLGPGKYIVAVSGGVDSVVLLDLLTQQQNLSEAASNQAVERQVFGAGLSKLPGVDLVVAHFDHGMRAGSAADADFVAGLAAKYSLPFELGLGLLGPSASEEEARGARYQFLESVKDKHQARAIITAHHQDDLIETAMFNLLRGSGRRGLVSLNSREGLVRPLLDIPKSDLIKYAREYKLTWHEDPSNQDLDYSRNYIRHKILNKLSISQRQQILQNLNTLKANAAALDPLLAETLELIAKDGQIDRQLFALLPSALGDELLAYLFSKQKITGYDKKTVQRANHALRTAKAGAKTNLTKDKFLVTSAESAWIEAAA